MVLFHLGGNMELAKLTNLQGIKVGDIFTIITSDYSDKIIQFIGRDPNLSPDSPWYEKSGYFVEVFGEKKVHYLRDSDLTDNYFFDKRDTYYIGYDEEFVLEKRIEGLSSLLHTLQDHLATLRAMKLRKA